MSETVFRSESAVEYFKGLVDDALARQHIAAGELTAFYVVHLLAGFLRRPAEQAQPLVVRLAQALEAGGSDRRDSLRQIGDLSLFVAGSSPTRSAAGSSTSTTTSASGARCTAP